MIKDAPGLTWEDVDICLDSALVEYGIPKLKVQTFKAHLKRKHQPAAAATTTTSSGGSGIIVIFDIIYIPFLSTSTSISTSPLFSFHVPTGMIHMIRSLIVIVYINLQQPVVRVHVFFSSSCFFKSALFFNCIVISSFFLSSRVGPKTPA